ncbi:hypothetical protein LUI11_35040 [Bradyrhizobium diazoefficiens]|uniref:Uncharacterized protein n=2 Tax=Bradyrhizobium diazoefficiens TaxID=1355477 RepID=A0A809ZMG0_9BRAD|nr:hypothetical protein [Bradyrhizobium diazoefficiens]APO49719.1 hypothetical protein BD122_05760 [Bradyrhizobium diazoefficiens]KGJ65566.1 hypothetical protein BJA5080_02212 [Bradyrhizobium diazoefficiens SEMIA 5080]KOY12371.1 hypothetical protein AF336_04400 [Bradyrhizobium diazoefficiens]MCD9296210.1 hypothetical protein [Bradyrhizobium diazoefficiens]MCD9813018.1 hypothetical protein [Bradyrhizobium diazoefficiens]
MQLTFVAVQELISERIQMTTEDHSPVSEELKERIRSLHRMSPGDWQEVLAALTDQSRSRAELQPSLLAALNVRITYDLVNALHKMDATSGALARKLIVLTWVLVIFTAVLLSDPAEKLIHSLLPLLSTKAH